jgi:hypothetical protein
VGPRAGEGPVEKNLLATAAGVEPRPPSQYGSRTVGGHRAVSMFALTEHAWGLVSARSQAGRGKVRVTTSSHSADVTDGKSNRG